MFVRVEGVEAQRTELGHLYQSVNHWQAQREYLVPS